MPARAREGYLEMKALAVLLALAAPLALAAEEAVRLDSAPIDPRDVASLQSGARSFVNYCLNCHSAGMMRYHKLLDLGLTEQQVKDNLLFTADKIGELMNVALTRKDAKEWLGTPPPDLSVIARARGPDWLYTYMRSFYRDPESATGWNNMVFERVAMPHVLWTLSGQQVQVARKFKNMEQAEAIGRQQKNAWKIDELTPDQAGKDGERFILKTIRTETSGSLSQVDYDIPVMNPYNRLAVLVERDLILYEANIINEYIDERFPHPQLMPTDPVMRARARLFLFQFEVELFAQIESLESGKEKQVERARQHVTDRLIELAPMFTKTKHMLGDDFTMLDVAIAPLLWRLDHYGIKLGKTAAPLMKYAERIFSRPAFIEALTPSEKVMRK